MWDIIVKILEKFVQGTDSNIVLLLLALSIYFGWNNHRQRKENAEEREKLFETIEKLQVALNQKTGEERQTLLEILDKYHESQISIKEAISEIRAVLSTLATIGRGV